MYGRAAPELVASSIGSALRNLQKLLYSFLGGGILMNLECFRARPWQDSCMPDQGQLLPEEHLPVVGPFASAPVKCPAEGAESAVPL